jgi:transposase
VHQHAARSRRRDLIPELWLPTPEDRALRELLRRRAHLVKARTSARNRIFGLLTQLGLRFSYARLAKPDGAELLERRGVPAVWRASITELLETLPQGDERAELLATIPGVGPLLSLTLAAEIGEISRFAGPGKAIGSVRPRR